MARLLSRPWASCRFSTRVENLHDAQGRLSSRAMLGSCSDHYPRPSPGLQTCLYDRTGNRCQFTETYVGQAAPRIVGLSYSMDSEHPDDGKIRSESIIEADGTVTLTTYKYDLAGNRTERDSFAKASITSNQFTSNFTYYSYNSANQL